jgi:hypothetical protein
MCVLNISSTWTLLMLVHAEVSRQDKEWSICRVETKAKDIAVRRVMLSSCNVTAA